MHKALLLLSLVVLLATPTMSQKIFIGDFPFDRDGRISFDLDQAPVPQDSTFNFSETNTFINSVFGGPANNSPNDPSGSSVGPDGNGPGNIPPQITQIFANGPAAKSHNPLFGAKQDQGGKGGKKGSAEANGKGSLLDLLEFQVHVKEHGERLFTQIERKQKRGFDKIAPEIRQLIAKNRAAKLQQSSKRRALHGHKVQRRNK